MKLRRLLIQNYRGVEERDIEIPPAGIIVSGKNAEGKTSVLNAIRAALAAEDVGPDAIRIGTERAEILVDLDALRVKRTIRANGDSLKVVDGNGVELKKPATLLHDLLGLAPYDALGVVLEKDKKKRRAMVLNALEAKASRAWLTKYAPLDEVPGLASVDFASMHGLEAIEKVREVFYELRRAANAREKERKGDLDRATEARRAFGDIGQAPKLEEALDVERNARGNLDKLVERRRVAEAIAQKTDRTRMRVADLRGQVAKLAEDAVKQRPAEEEMSVARSRAIAADAEVERLRAALADAFEEQKQAANVLGLLTAADAEATEATRRSVEMERQATDLESTLSDTAVDSPSDEALEVAGNAVRTAEQTVADAKRAETGRVQEHAVQTAREAHEKAEREAERLGRIVHKLTNDAPRALISESGGIDGLEVLGDDLALDGVRLDSLCGAERLWFAAQIAKRLNAKSKILICDGLERIAPKEIEEFVKFATADGWQLICTRVADGELVVEAIQP